MVINYESKIKCLKLKRTDSTILTSIQLPFGKSQIISIPSPTKIKSINKKNQYSKL